MALSEKWGRCPELCGGIAVTACISINKKDKQESAYCHIPTRACYSQL